MVDCNAASHSAGCSGRGSMVQFFDCAQDFTTELRFADFTAIPVQAAGVAEAMQAFMVKHEPKVKALLAKRASQPVQVQPQPAFRPAFAHGKAFTKPTLAASNNAFAELAAKPKTAATKKERKGVVRKSNAAPRSLSAKWKRAKSDADDGEDFCDDDDDEEEFQEEIDKVERKPKKVKAKGKGKSSKTTKAEERASNLGGFAGLFGQGQLAEELKRQLSDEPTLVAQFLLRCAATFGEQGFPVHTAALWDTLVRDLAPLLGGESGNHVKWSAKLKALKFSAVKSYKTEGDILFPDESEASARGKVLAAVQEAARFFTAPQISDLKGVFAAAGDAFAQRWGRVISSVVRTPLSTNTERLLFEIVRSAADDCFSDIDTADFDREKVKEFNSVRYKWSSEGTVEGLVFGGTMKEMQKELKNFGGELKGFEAVVERCNKAVAKLQFRVGDNLDAIPQTAHQRFAARDSSYATFPSLLGLLTTFEGIWRERCPLWKGYQRYPQVQKRWRCSTNSSELKKGQRFGHLRAAVRLASNSSSPHHNNLDAALAAVLADDSLGDRANWRPNEGQLTWINILRLAGDPTEWPVCMVQHRAAVFKQYETCSSPEISIVTDGHVAKLVGKVDVEATPWLAKDSNAEVRLLAEGLVGIAGALGVNLKAELLRRIQQKNKTKEKFKVLDSDALWTFIKDNTTLAPDQWAESVFGGPNPEAAARAQSQTVGHKTYAELQKGRSEGVEWCRRSKVTGMVPSRILAEIRGERFDDVVAVYIDPGMKNPMAGVWRYVDKKTGSVMMQPWRVTTGLYHQRTGANREREWRESHGNVALSWADRMSDQKAKMRRLTDEGKRQFKLEIAAGFRLAADQYGDGRDFAVIVEHNGKESGGNSHRKPATKEFIQSLAHFFLVGRSSGFKCSQCCSCCGEQLQFAGKPREIRSKVCKSPRCPATEKAQAKERLFFADRDTNAAVNLALIDEAEARGEGRPERFQSQNYKRRQNVSSFAGSAGD